MNVRPATATVTGAAGQIGLRRKLYATMRKVGTGHGLPRQHRRPGSLKPLQQRRRDEADYRRFVVDPADECHPR